MRTKLSNGFANRYALLALVVWAPLGLGAKGCDHALVGDDGHCTVDCPSGEAGAESGGSSGTGGDAGKGGTSGTSGDAGKGGAPGTGGAADTGGTAGKGGASATGGSSATGGAAGSAGQGGSSGDATCDGLQGLACPATQYCAFPLAAQCGAADQTGTCSPLPDACDTIYAPVCGCDDKTYGNDCEAARAGVSVAAKGECASGATTCGGRSQNVCQSSEYCAFTLDAICGFADATGTCQPKPDGCTTQYAPVCGCDGKTYGNDCEANRAGTSVQSEGACAGDGATCGGLQGLTCGAGQFCNFDAANCGSGDQTGTCQAIPDLCPQVESPVCGCDGVQYGNSCFANAAGVAVSNDTSCETPGATCGGLRGSMCPADQYCDFPSATKCGSGDQTGSCKAMHVVCPQVTGTTLEVCGCDGKTYGSSCFAQQAGVSVASNGACQ